MSDTLLKRLCRERRLTRPQAVAVLQRRARDMGLGDEYSLSLREFDRFLKGEVVEPHPTRTRVIEAEFGRSISELLSLDDPLERGHELARPGKVVVDVHRLVHDAALESTQFAQWADSLGIGDLALTTLWLRVEQLATAYVHAPMVPTFCELQELRDELFGLLLAPEPGQARDLYLLAGLACGMLAHASGNLGDLRAAHLQACTALACARKADHPTLAAWILGVRALQCEWNDRPDETVTATARAREHLARERVCSTVSVWIDAIEARAWARLGRPRDAVLAIERATKHRGQLPCAPGDERNDLDQLAGVLTFPEAKQHYYVGSALRRIGKMDQAQVSSTAAIEIYTSGPADQRSYGDEAIARIDLAIARSGGDACDVDGSAEAFEQLTKMPSALCLPTMAGPLRELHTALSAPTVRDARVAVQLREAVRTILSTCEETNRMITP